MTEKERGMINLESSIHDYAFPPVLPCAKIILQRLVFQAELLHFQIQTVVQLELSLRPR